MFDPRFGKRRLQGPDPWTFFFLCFQADMPTIHDHTSKNKAFAFHLSTRNTVFPPSPEGSLPDPHRPPKAPRGITSRDMHLAQAVDQVLPVICWYIDRSLRRIVRLSFTLFSLKVQEFALTLSLYEIAVCL